MNYQIYKFNQFRRRGFVAVWVALTIFVLFLLVGLTFDIGRLCLMNHQLHNAADSSALAGAIFVKIDSNEARERAQCIALQNFVGRDPIILELNSDNLPSGDIIVGQYGYDPYLDKAIFVPDDLGDPGPVNALAVVTSRTSETGGGPIPLIFGRCVGVNTAELCGSWVNQSGPYAIAVAIGGTGAGLICLRHDYTGLDLGGGGVLTVNSETSNVNDGAVQINSFDSIGLSSNGRPDLNAQYVNLCADDSDMRGREVGLDSLLQYRQPPIPDPLIDIPPPSCGAPVMEIIDRLSGEPIVLASGRPITISTGEDVFLPAGYYPEGWRITGGKVTLESGIYILGGSSQGLQSGLYINGGDLDASAVTTGNDVPGMGGVMFYITDDGIVNIGGEGTIVVDPMTEYQCMASSAIPAYEGISIFVDRESTHTSIIRGTSELNLTGTLYFPQKIDYELDYLGYGKQDYALELHGIGAGFGNQIIADSVYISGTADVVINYDGRNRAPITKAYLME